MGCSPQARCFRRLAQASGAPKDEEHKWRVRPFANPFAPIFVIWLGCRPDSFHELQRRSQKVS